MTEQEEQEIKDRVATGHYWGRAANDINILLAHIEKDRTKLAKARQVLHHFAQYPMARDVLKEIA